MSLEFAHYSQFLAKTLRMFSDRFPKGLQEDISSRSKAPCCTRAELRLVGMIESAAIRCTVSEARATYGTKAGVQRSE
jgi:hypothetical protein